MRWTRELWGEEGGKDLQQELEKTGDTIEIKRNGHTERKEKRVPPTLQFGRWK